MICRMLLYYSQHRMLAKLEFYCFAILFAIFVQCCQEAYNGQIVVALIDDSATVKRFYKEKDHIRLQPENDTMAPIIVDDCQVIGRVFGMMRIFH